MDNEEKVVVVKPPNVSLMILTYALGIWFGTWPQFYTPDSVSDWLRNQPEEVRNAVYVEREVNDWLYAQPAQVRHDMIYAWLDDDKRKYIALKYCEENLGLCRAAWMSAPVAQTTIKGERREKKSTK